MRGYAKILARILLRLASYQLVGGVTANTKAKTGSYSQRRNSRKRHNQTRHGGHPSILDEGGRFSFVWSGGWQIKMKYPRILHTKLHTFGMHNPRVREKCGATHPIEKRLWSFGDSSAVK